MRTEAVDLLKRISSRYGEALESVPAVGLRNMAIRGVYERILVITDSTAKNLFNKAYCLAKNEENCVRSDGTEYCSIGCGNLGLIDISENSLGLSIAKYGNNASSIKISGEGLFVSSKDFYLLIKSDLSIAIRLPGKDQLKEMNIDLSDHEAIIDNNSLIKYVFRKADRIIGKMLEAENYCIKQRMIAC
ncbi:MAG: hypothetical protein LRS47_01870 [Desulfurococcales archaeon]|nr:hypothetical protein [Desulfurococcales archaeon]